MKRRLIMGRSMRRAAVVQLFAALLQHLDYRFDVRIMRSVREVGLISNIGDPLFIIGVLDLLPSTGSAVLPIRFLR